MNLTIDELLRGKATVIKGKEYFNTAAYVTPFLERMQKYTDNFIVQVKTPDQMSLTKNGELNLEDMVFNRVYIQAVLPEYMQFENHKQVVGLVYGLDVRKPVYKIFSGSINCACTNLCVFNPDMLECCNLEPEEPMNFKSVTRMAEQIDEVSGWLNRIKNIEVRYDRPLIDENLGSWIRNSMDCSYDNGFGKVKLAASNAIDAYKLLYMKDDSPYYVKPGDSTSMFNVYNAFTELISNDSGKDIINKCEKVLLLKDILSIG